MESFASPNSALGDQLFNVWICLKHLHIGEEDDVEPLFALNGQDILVSHTILDLAIKKSFAN
jgi:hypothetical protein